MPNATIAPLFNATNAILPFTRFHALRAFLFHSFGMNVNSSAKINGGCKIFGRGTLSVGANTWIGINCRFYIAKPSAVEICENVDIGPQVTFISGSHVVGDATRRAGLGTTEPIEIGAGTWIGGNSTILGGARVERGCIIAAGSIVLPGRYQANSLLAGVPARIIKSYPEN